MNTRLARAAHLSPWPLLLVTVPQLIGALLIGLLYGTSQSLLLLGVAFCFVVARVGTVFGARFWIKRREKVYLERESDPLTCLVMTAEGRVERRIGPSAHVLGEGERFLNYD